jgi:hypothetical protein
MVDGIATTFAAVYTFLSFSFIISQNGCWLLLLNLIYYAVSHRISLLTSYIDTMNKQDDKNTVESKIVNIRKLRWCSYLFDQTCLALNEINSTFSLSILLNVVILLIICTTSLYGIIFIITANPTKIPSVIQDSTHAFLGITMHSVTIICIILKSVESPILEV